MNNPLVSVIIPNYCHAKYLDQRIQSVLNQTYQNFEVIILDDASPDDGASRAVIEKYRENPHVTHIVYNEKNSGSTFKQWHKGIKLAKGELIWIAESDDYCEHVFLSILVPYFSQFNNLSFCYSNIIPVTCDGKSNVGALTNYHNEVDLPYSLIGTDYIKKYCIVGCPIWNASSVIFQKKYSNKCFMIEDFHAIGDYLFWILLAEQGNVFKTNMFLSYFRRSNNTVTSNSLKTGISIIEMKKVYNYLSTKGYMSFYQKKYMKIYYVDQALSFPKSNQHYYEIQRIWNPYSFYNPRFMAFLWFLLKTIESILLRKRQ